MSPLSRREALKRGLLGVAGVATAGTAAKVTTVTAVTKGDRAAHLHATDPHAIMTGGVPHASASGIDPMAFLTDFDYGTVSRVGGRTVREFEMVASDRNIEVMPGVWYAAWTYNGQVPGPTLRATEGDLVRVKFVNGGSHEHTIHFHGVHASNMDGVFEVIPPGGSYVYEFEAQPFGLHLYHCHTIPIKRHIAKGLYGAFIVDPKKPRPPAKELVMVMNGFDVNFDGENEIYAVNSIPFAYQANPIPIQRNELVRIYLVNVLEFDLINSFHLHGNFFHVYRSGTSLEPSDFTDTIALCQGERHILELRYKDLGKFMFHAHQSEFTELGWMGMFDVRDDRTVA